MAEKPEELGTKSWDFPKIHSQQHLFDDIVAKGATRNFNTKPNESLNRPLKKKYLRSNFKDVAEQVKWTVKGSSYCLMLFQILNLDHLEYLVSFMRMKLDKFDSALKEKCIEEPDTVEQTGGLSVAMLPEESSINFYLGAPEREGPLSELKGATKFSVPNFPQMLEVFLNKFRTQQEGYYRVRRDHGVSVPTPPPPHGKLTHL